MTKCVPTRDKRNSKKLNLLYRLKKQMETLTRRFFMILCTPFLLIQDLIEATGSLENTVDFYKENW